VSASDELRRIVEGDPPPAARVRVIRASDVQSRSIRWAWEGRLALGYLVVQTGIEGLGKSVFASWMIARLTRGELPGEFEGKPVNVLVVAGEDGIEDTWKPRLDLAGADSTRVGFLALDDLPDDWNLHGGIDALRGAATDTGARVVFIDAALDHMPPGKGGEGINSPTFIRAAFKPLKRLVRDLDLVGLFSMHPPKTKSAEFRDLVQNSQAFGAIPRVGLLFTWHPQDAELPNDQRRRVLVRGKGNLGRDPGALEFRVVGQRYEHDDGQVGDREVVVDVGPSDVTMADRAPEKTLGAREPNKTERAAEYMRDALAGGDWRPAAPIIDALRSQGLGSDSVITEARRKAGVKYQRARERGARSEWRIPRAQDENVVVQMFPADVPSQQQNGELPHAASSVPNGAGDDVAERIREQAQNVRCSCARPGEPAPDGRCSQCWGWPS
jgi:hypothetical protein